MNGGDRSRGWCLIFFKTFRSLSIFIIGDLANWRILWKQTVGIPNFLFLVWCQLCINVSQAKSIDWLRITDSPQRLVFNFKALGVWWSTRFHGIWDLLNRTAGSIFERRGVSRQHPLSARFILTRPCKITGLTNVNEALLEKILLFDRAEGWSQSAACLLLYTQHSIAFGILAWFGFISHWGIRIWHWRVFQACGFNYPHVKALILFGLALFALF